MMDDNIQNIEQENINNAIEQENLSSDQTPEEIKQDDVNTTVISLEEKMAEIHDKYLRLSAEFDNYRKRTLKERYDLIKTANEDTIQGLLPIIDDFERGINLIDKAEDIIAIKEGINLIYDKLMAYLKQKGLSEIEVLNKDFNTDNSEAVAKIAVDDSEKKGKVIDVIQKAYVLNDKIIRHAKVVIGQ
jgi:molecular chaperone GrpE